MKITKLEVFILRAPDTGRPHWVSHFIVPRANEILVRLGTDEGVEGFGLATSYTPIEAAIHAFRSGIGDQVIGADALAPEQLFQKLFGLTSQRLAHEKAWSREALMRISPDDWDCPPYDDWANCAMKWKCSRHRGTRDSRQRPVVCPYPKT